MENKEPDLEMRYRAFLLKRLRWPEANVNIRSAVVVGLTRTLLFPILCLSSAAAAALMSCRLHATRLHHASSVSCCLAWVLNASSAVHCWLFVCGCCCWLFLVPSMMMKFEGWSQINVARFPSCKTSKTSGNVMSHPVLLYTYYTLAYTGKASFLAWLSYIGMDKQEKFRLLDFLTPEVSCVG